MLCCPALVHKTVLGLGQQTEGDGEAPVVPVLVQWVNSHGRPFSGKDVKVASAFTDVLGRIASEKTMSCSVSLLEERFRIGDRRRNALMESARMLANRMEMKELFAAVMQMAKELMEVERSTLFMVDKKKNIMYTIVADGADPIEIPYGAGLAGAAGTTGKAVNVADAYLDHRFNRDIDLKTGYRTKTVLCFPIFNSRDEVIAVIQLINKRSGLKFSRADEELIAAFCSQLAVSIENVLAIEDMNKSSSIAAAQKQRMLRFLDFVVDFVGVGGLPAHEVCEVAYRAAMECTDSSGAALFICKDSASNEVLPPQEVDLEGMLADPGRSQRRGSTTRVRPSKEAAAATRSVAVGDDDDDDDDELDKLVQVAPPIAQGTWMRVTRLCHQVLADRTMVSAEIDINDQGLPEELKGMLSQEAREPRIVPCMAMPIMAGSGAGEEVQGVLAVWGSDEYSTSDQHVMSTLATLANYLLSSLRKAGQTRKELNAIQQTAHSLQGQRDAMVKFANKLGASEPNALHKVAMGLPPTLNCSSCVLWLVTTNPKEQRIVTQLPAPPAVEDNADGGGNGGEYYTATSRRSRTLELSLNGQGILGHVITTAKPLNVGDAHIFRGYQPTTDEAVFKLQKGYTAICAVPLCDHTGRVLGVLQASGKLKPPVDDASLVMPGLEVWEQDVLDTPAFTQGDVDFLVFIADRMAAQLHYLDVSGNSPKEVVDQQAVTAELQSRADAQLTELVSNRRKLVEMSHEAYRLKHEADPRRGSVHGSIQSAHRGALSESRSSLVTPSTPASVSMPRFPRVERPNSRGGAVGTPIGAAATPAAAGVEAKLAAHRTSSHRHSASQPQLVRDGGAGRGAGPPLPKVLSKAEGGLPRGGGDLALNTPEAVWEELCRSLREL